MQANICMTAATFTKESGGTGKKTVEVFSPPICTLLFPESSLFSTGTYKWTDGDVYEGEWRDGKQHGRGESIFQLSQANTIEAWIDGR